MLKLNFNKFIKTINLYLKLQKKLKIYFQKKHKQNILSKSR